MTQWIWILAFALVMSGCSGSKTERNGNEPAIEEIGQQMGDVMASIDEAGGNSGSISWQPSDRDFKKTFARLAPGQVDAVPSLFFPAANATSCSAGTGFGNCSGGLSVTRLYGGCSVGFATFSGSVTLTWSPGNNCSLAATGNTISRSPNFSVTGRRGATLSVTRSGTFGQKLTWLSGSGGAKGFSFQSDGIRRVFASGGTTLFDYTTTTTTNITVTGANRSSRIMSGGNLRVTNNLTADVCDYVPSSVTWSSSCNCAVSGTWSGTCTGGKSTTLNITGCGSGTLIVDGESTPVDFDRCGS